MSAVTGETPAFTPAPRNRPLQALIAAFFVLPQLALYFWWYAEDRAAYSEIPAYLSESLRLGMWQRWLHSVPFLLVLAALAIERAVYTYVWLFPSRFVAAAGSVFPAQRPIDVVVGLFYVSKAFQYGAIFGWYFWTAPPVAVASVSLLRWVTGLQLVVMGQVLNIAIYNAIGKAGVYYGFKLGASVPWCLGFPFNVFTMHPQYSGCVMTIVGAGILLATPQHAADGWFGIGWIGAAYYAYMAVIEDIPCEHPLDDSGSPWRARSSPVRLRDMRHLKWSTPRSESWDTSENILGLMSRPWFPWFLATVAAANCFVMVLSVPLTVLFAICCAQDRGIINWAAAVCASGAALGAAGLGWVIEAGAAEGVVPLTQQAVDTYWPRTAAAVAGHGWWGCAAASVVVHPLPVVDVGLRQQIPGTGLVLAVFAGSYLHFLLVGAAITVWHCTLRRSAVWGVVSGGTRGASVGRARRD